jgi:hypothetical protein
MEARLADFESETAKLTARRGFMPTLVNVSVPPNLAVIDRRKLEDLATRLEDTEPCDEA